jgi:hypothetical protein
MVARREHCVPRSEMSLQAAETKLWRTGLVGGESGPNARPLHLAWAEEIVVQCRGAGVPCFVKQLGAVAYCSGKRVVFGDRKGGDWTEWPSRLRVRQFPERPEKSSASNRRLTCILKSCSAARTLRAYMPRLRGLDFGSLARRRHLRAFENRAEARTHRVRLFEPAA